MILGNAKSQSFLKQELQSSSSDCILLCGPEGVGKRSFLVEQFSTLPEEDIVFAGTGVDDARQVVDFCRTHPILGSRRFVVVDKAEDLTDPAQDALLKLLEETPDKSRILLVSCDKSGLRPTVLSRVRTTSVWELLAESDMLRFAGAHGVVDEFALKIARGRPGVYASVSHMADLRDLYRVCHMVLEGNVGLVGNLPTFLKDAKEEPRRSAAFYCIERAVLDSEKRSAWPLMRFAADLRKIPSLNLDLHWHRMLISLSGM